MANMFTLLLTIATLLTGLLWCLDKFLWAPKRQKKVEKIRSETEGNVDGKELAKIGRPASWIESVSSLFPALAIVFIIRSFIYEPFQIPSGSMMPTLLIGDFILVEKYAYGIKEPITNTTLIKTGKPKRGDVVVFKYPKDPSVDFIKRTIALPGDHVKYDTKAKTVTVIPKCENNQSETCNTQQYLLSYTPVVESDFVQQFDKIDYKSSFYKKEDKQANPNDKSSVITIPLLTRTETIGDVTHDIFMLPNEIGSSASYYRQDNLPNSEWIVPPAHYFVLGDNRDNSEDSRYWGFVPEKNLVGKATAIWISFEKQPGKWPTGIRFNRIGGLH